LGKTSGKITHQNLHNFKIDIQATSKRFYCMNTTYVNNNSFYGILHVNSTYNNINLSSDYTGYSDRFGKISFNIINSGLLPGPHNTAYATIYPNNRSYVSNTVSIPLDGVYVDSSEDIEFIIDADLDRASPDIFEGEERTNTYDREY
jgi:hypothetical protein